MKIKKQNAITLIALIITIIIMLILVGTVITLIIGENGLFNTAKYAAKKWNNSVEKEQADLDELYAYINRENLQENTKENPQEIGKEVALKDGWGIQTVKYTNTKNGVEVKDITKIATVYAVSVGNGNTVPVPKNFWYVGGTLDTGVIISDNKEDQYDGITDKTTYEYTRKLKGNQFIWIPCEVENYKKTSWGKQSAEYDTTTPEAELTQIEKYGGFYVARYEAGLANTIPEFTDTQTNAVSSQIYNKEGIPQSKAGIAPWNFIDWNNAKKNAKSMYINNNYVNSGLVTGTQWDVILNTLVSKNVINASDLTNSNTWGNYRNTVLTYNGRLTKAYTSSGKWYLPTFGSETINGTTTEYKSDNAYGDLLTTGASNQTEKYHIFDIAGNIREWTEEDSHYSTSGQCRVTRGGAFHMASNTYPACYRDADACIGSSLVVGFRVVLYIK